MNTFPNISVILPTFNRPEILALCLEGFAGQTIPRDDFEVVIVDDGSKPPVREVADRFGRRLNIVYRYQENAGLAAARNACITLANAPLLALHDDDDVPAPDYLQRCLAFHARHPGEAEILLAQVAPHPGLEPTPLLEWMFDGANGIIGFPDPSRVHDFWSFFGGTSSCKKSLFRFGLCDPSYRFGFEDTELAIRMDRQVKLRVHYDPLAISFLVRPPDFPWMFRRSYREGRSHHRLYRQHGEMTLVGVGHDALHSAEIVASIGAELPAILSVIPELESAIREACASEAKLAKAADDLKTAYYLCRKYCRARGWLEFGVGIDENDGLAAIDGLLAGYLRTTEKRPAIDTAVLPAGDIIPVIARDSAPRNDNRPVVSVVIPCYNHASLLPHAVASVIDQTFQRFEIVIVNDGSTDESAKVAAHLATLYPGHAIRVINQENSGRPAIARNRGIAASSGRYVLCLDADDMIMPTMLEECVVLLDTEPGVAIAYTDQIHFDRETCLAIQVADYHFPSLVQQNFIGCCSMFRRTVWEEVGGYPTDVGYEDWDFWISCGERGHVGRRIPQALFCYQLSETGQYGRDLQKDAAIRAAITLKHPTLYSAEAVADAHKLLAAAGRSEAFRVVALISAHNEGDVIHHVIGDLIAQGCQVYLINHCSTDDTVEQASKWLGRGLIHIENFPQDAGYPEENRDQYIWHHILRRKEELAAQLDADWFIHTDADEFRESPWPGMTLGEGIRVADRMGYNAIDFELLNFRPTDDAFVPGTDVRDALRYYEPAEDFNAYQVKAWKNLGIPVSIFRNGGHDITFEGRSVCPVKFILRHYPVRSQAHGLRKVFAERKNRFNADERKAGWHIQYAAIADERHNFVRNPDELTRYDGDAVRLAILSAEARAIAAALPATAALLPAAPSVKPAAPVVTNDSTAAADTADRLIGEAHAQVNGGAYGDAARLYREAMDISPGNGRALVGLGVALFLEGQLDEAVGSFREALAADPGSAGALCGLGMVRSAQGNGEEGFSLYRQALDIDPENLTALHELLKAGYRNERLDEAEPYLKGYLMYHPADEHMLFSLAGLQYRTGRYDDAYDNLERLLILKPSYEGGMELMREVAQTLSDRDGTVLMAAGS